MTMQEAVRWQNPRPSGKRTEKKREEAFFTKANLGMQSNCRGKPWAGTRAAALRGLAGTPPSSRCRAGGRFNSRSAQALGLWALEKMRAVAQRKYLASKAKMKSNEKRPHGIMAKVLELSQKAWVFISFCFCHLLTL